MLFYVRWSCFRLHVEVFVVSFSSSLVFFGNSVQKMCTSAPLPYNNENTDSRSTSIAQIYLDFFLSISQVYLTVILSIFLRSMLLSSPPGTFVLTSWQVVITTSGAFKSLWSEQDGDLTFLHKIQWFFLTLHLQNDEWRMCIIVFFLFSVFI